MRIGQIAERSGVHAETVRYYERIGLVGAPRRTGAGYRDYDGEHLKRLTMIRHSRELGFSIAEIRILLRLANRRGGSCEPVKALAQRQSVIVKEKIVTLRRLSRELDRLVRICSGENLNRCRIIEALVANESPSRR